MTSNCFKIGSTLASKMVDSFSGLQDARGAIGREICQIRELDAQRMMQALARAGGNGTTSPTTVYVLGKRFDIQKHEHAQDLLERLRGIMWFSYRRSFQPVPRTSPPVTGDAGWGCMVRSSQMLLAQALRRPDASPLWAGRPRHPILWTGLGPRPFCLATAHSNYDWSKLEIRSDKVQLGNMRV